MSGNHEKAIGYFESALRLNPAERNGWRNMALSYRALGQEPKARECEAKFAE